MIFRCPDPKVKGHLVTGPIQKITNGYSSLIKIFRFEGSKKVRIRCSVNVCLDSCSKTICQDDENISKESSVNDNSFKYNNLKKRYSDISEEKVITGIFSIIDNKIPKNSQSMSLEDNRSTTQKYCLSKLTFEGVIIFVILSFIHSIASIIVWIRKVFIKKNIK